MLDQKRVKSFFKREVCAMRKKRVKRRKEEVCNDDFS